jgi:hypothetical protein
VFDVVPLAAEDDARDELALAVVDVVLDVDVPLLLEAETDVPDERLAAEVEVLVADVEVLVATVVEEAAVVENGTCGGGALTTGRAFGFSVTVQLSTLTTTAWPFGSTTGVSVIVHVWIISPATLDR